MIDSAGTSANIILPLRDLVCPVCGTPQVAPGDDYLALLQCGCCSSQFRYLDGYLLLFQGRADQFVSDELSIPLVPGFTVGNELWVEPNEIYQIAFNISFGKPPNVLFFSAADQAAPDMLRDNLYVTAISIKSTEFLILTRTFERSRPSQRQLVRWMAIGELKIEREKPLWLTYLDNAVELIDKDEKRAAVVILLIALDFFYDEQLSLLGISYDDIRTRGRRPGMNEKRAKLQMLQEMLEPIPEALAERLRDITDHRNRIVHPIVRRNEVPDITPEEAFATVIDTIHWVLASRYRRRVV